MPERPRKKPTAKKPTAPKRPAPAKKSAAPKAPAQRKDTPRPVAASQAPAGDVCPRCGTMKFGPEERIRAEGNRTVRYTVLVCERGHTFARAVTRTR